ncbi:MAG: FkbM family methyltransferase [Candidatus Woesearchaeota archaeon]
MPIDRIQKHAFSDSINTDSIVLALGASDFIREFIYKYPCKLLVVEASPDKVTELEALNLESPILNAAISTKTGQASLYINANTSSLYRNLAEINGFMEDTPSYVKPQDTITETITLQEVLKRYKLEKIDLLVVDIRGSEWDMFNTFTQHEADIISEISVIFHDYLDPTYRKQSEDAIEKLKSLGYNADLTGTTKGFGSPYFHCLFSR